MDKIAFVFSGQGDQYPGMGKSLYEKYDAAKAVFDMCEELRPGTLAQCFEGTDEELKETRNTQPCLFAMELAAASVLFERGIRPSAVAGFSLGEVVAATVAGVFEAHSGFKLVCKRGELMQEAAEKHDTSMAAVVKLTLETVITLCSQCEKMYPVNFNCPGQITVSGLTEQMPKLSQLVKEAGGRAIPVKVKGAFHSPFMNEAAKAFENELSRIEMHDADIKLYSNATAQPYQYDAVELLSKQICSPVQWEAIINNMIAEGINTFIEIGPGKTLSNMIKKIDGNVKIYSVSDLDTLLSEVESC